MTSSPPQLLISESMKSPWLRFALKLFYKGKDFFATKALCVPQVKESL